MHIEAWSRYWSATGHTMNSRKDGTGIVCGFYAYLLEQGAIESNPAERVRRPRVPRMSDGSSLTREQAARFLQLAESEPDDAQALCLLLLLNGMRIGEALALDTADIDIGASTVRITRKYGFVQHLRMPQETAAVLARITAGRDHGPLLRNAKGKRMNEAGADRIVSRLGRQAGAARRISPHSLRRTFATLSRDAGIPDRQITAMAGWADSDMLDYYDQGRMSTQFDTGAQLQQYISQAQ
ncbi:tyrosine-type recombinase/integrase [Bifidobacterium tibiigranuli]|jgi:integrase|uniref:tyrosine-type recombinase/integrase n=1 Tax=Bifidobacterium tibiigranuli TaxID=2172043 RepID=UPI00235654F8|nr:site-specific integrase [Bifidobacterium tibiigranuli]MCH3975976.1 site-specific integrase [Bifidobacterium tibiigranuli]MCI1713354.1 site-specific integrase [Bifidobacterium tibiigranuli]MCI2184844.1 site-specific integrase [Bifidobacterium tibiigranuli]MCI2204365.1 site-specific integrase [Bifidobacterium tibiigranuli]